MNKNNAKIQSRKMKRKIGKINAAEANAKDILQHVATKFAWKGLILGVVIGIPVGMYLTTLIL